MPAKSSHFARAIAALALCVAGSGGCSSPGFEGAEDLGSRQDPIFGGTADTSHDAVMALLHIERNRAGSCTGTTIATQAGSGILLTAAHCVSAMDVDGNVLVPVKPLDPSGFEVIVGPDWQASASASKSFAVAEVTINPQFEGSVQSPFDIATVRYLGATAATPIIPALSPAADLLMVGTNTTLYGYGSTETVVDNTQRRKVDKVISQLNARQILYDQKDGKGSCRGDSGGPSVVQTPSGERVAAVTSYGDQDCTVAGVSVRVSAAATFLQGALARIPTQLSCAECRYAALAPDNKCFSQRVVCSGTSPCGRFLDCAAPCNDSACVDACVSRNPSGAQASDALAECQCVTACGTECATDPSCGSPACGGLAVAGAVCTSCIQQTCCQQAEACGANPNCLACFRHSGGTQCTTDPLYTGFLGCLSRCSGNPCKVATPGGTGADAGPNGGGAAGGGAGAGGDSTAIHYSADIPPAAASEGGCSCRQTRSSRGPLSLILAMGLSVLSVARVRSKRQRPNFSR